MMNSMSRTEIAKGIVLRYINPVSFDEISEYQAAIVVQKDQVIMLLSVLKNEGWRQLSYLSAIDWLEENQFEMVYVLMNWDLGYHLQIRAKIDREFPEMPTAISIYPGAIYYERECHEFFGIAFPGNPTYEKQLILENWDDMPPLRKDFDPKAYSDRKFAAREYSETYIVSDPNNHQKMKREKRKVRAASLRGEKK